MSTDQVEEKSRRRRRRRSAENDDSPEEQLEAGVTEGKGIATPGRRNRGKEVQEGNFITRPLRGLFEYMNGVRDELRKVTWPTREELTRLTIIVSIVTVISALVLGGVSLIFTEFFILGFENEILFVIGGVVAVVGYFVVTRFFSGGQDTTPY